MATSTIKNTQLKVLTKTETVTVTYNNLRYATYDADISESGYTALGVVGFRCDDSVNNEFNMLDVYSNQLSVTLYRTNGNASSESVVIRLRILYQRI